MVQSIVSKTHVADNMETLIRFLHGNLASPVGYDVAIAALASHTHAYKSHILMGL